jgi:hypothetical protein
MACCSSLSAKSIWFSVRGRIERPFNCQILQEFFKLDAAS